MTAVDRGSDLEALLCLIAARHGDMPPVLCRIAEFALDHPNEVALETVAELVRQAPGQPPVMIGRRSRTSQQYCSNSTRRPCSSSAR
jgi:hypothetical protein